MILKSYILYKLIRLKRELQNKNNRLNFKIRQSLLTHSEWRPQNFYSQEEMNLYFIIKLATEILYFHYKSVNTWCFGYSP